MKLFLSKYKNKLIISEIRRTWKEESVVLKGIISNLKATYFVFNNCLSKTPRISLIIPDWRESSHLRNYTDNILTVFENSRTSIERSFVPICI